MRVLYISLLIIIIDQISKLLVKGIKLPFLGKLGGIKFHQSIKVIDDFLMITKVENYGVAFGLEFGDKLRYVVIFITVLVVIFLLFYLILIKNKAKIVRLSIALIIAGAVGNLIDRTFYSIFFDHGGKLFQGRVVDFIQIRIFDFSIFGRTFDSLPIFNVSDISILIGTILLIIFSWKNNKPENQNEVKEGIIKE